MFQDHMPGNRQLGSLMRIRTYLMLSGGTLIAGLPIAIAAYFFGGEIGFAVAIGAVFVAYIAEKKLMRANCPDCGKKLQHNDPRQDALTDRTPRFWCESCGYKWSGYLSDGPP